MNSEVNVILGGIVGSTAYGLAGPDSDVDRLGIFAAPTVDFLGLNPPKESIVEHAPDVTMHEVGKFCRLALAGNPTVIRGNLLRGLDLVAVHIEAGTFHEIPPGKSSPPAQAGQLTLILLRAVDAELSTRESP